MTHMYPDNHDKKDELNPNIRRKFATKTPTILNKEINWDSDPMVEVLKDEKNDQELEQMKAENKNLFNTMSNPFSQNGGFSLFDQGVQQ